MWVNIGTGKSPRAWYKARTSSCQSNLKQLTLGLLMYAQDYDETFMGYAASPLPGGATFPYLDGGTGTNITWMVRAYPYVKNFQVFSCPSDTRTWVGQYSTKSAYGLNILAFPNFGKPNLADFAYPAETSMIGESDGAASWGYGFSASGAFARHTDGLNVAFVDGHVKWIGETNIPAATATSKFWYAQPTEPATR